MEAFHKCLQNYFIIPSRVNYITIYELLYMYVVVVISYATFVCIM